MHGSERNNGPGAAGRDLGHQDPAATSQDDKLIIPSWLRLAGVLFGLIIVAAMAFAIFEPIQVLPRIRLAPGYALTAENGETVTSETARGTVTLYSFAPTDCQDRCEELFETMRVVQDRVSAEVDLEDTRFKLVTVALDRDVGTDALSLAAERSGADGQNWRWIGGDERRVRTVVGDGFRRFFQHADDGTIDFDPGFVLVDGAGIIRGEYRYRTLADESDKLVRHVGILADEIRHADGATAVAYEAAHLFLCYP